MPRVVRYLKDEFPTLFKEIDIEATQKEFPGLDLDKLGKGSNRKIYWKCDEHLEYPYKAQVYIRTRMKTNCAICAGKQIIRNYNSFAHLHPDLATQQHPDSTVDLFACAPSSRTKVDWLCKECGHSWVASLNTRVNGKGCFKCGHKKVGVTNATPKRGMSLAEKNPQLVQQWHPTKNTLTPAEVSFGSVKSVWWVCSNSHEWRAPVNNRSKGAGCKKCSEQGVSKLEHRLIAALNEVPELQVTSHSLQSTFRWQESNRKMEVDIVVMNIKNYKTLFVEVDGSYWHRDKQTKDVEKTQALLTAYPSTGVVRIRCEELEHLPIEHERLLQLDYDFSFKDEGLHDVAEQVRQFLNSDALAEPVVWEAE